MQRDIISRSQQSGFTLVELSIVLVIIGLIVSSVLVGQDLVKSAAVRNVISQREGFDAAVFTFRGKYNVLPGDGLGKDVASLPCNGNNDGLLALGTAAVTAASATAGAAAAGTGDSACFWQTLSQAGTGLIPGNFTGVVATASNANIAAIQPQSKISGAYWGAYSNSLNINYYMLGISYGATVIQGATALVDGVSAMSIDSKIDDGLSGAGVVMAYPASTAGPDSGTVIPLYTPITPVALRFKMQSM